MISKTKKGISVLLFNMDAQALLSMNNIFNQNPLSGILANPTISTQVPAGYKLDTALLRAANGELDIPAVQVTQEELYKIILFHPELLDLQAYVAEIAFKGDFESTRKGDQDPDVCQEHIFLGAYNGKYKHRRAIYPLDHDKSGIASVDIGNKIGDYKTLVGLYGTQIRDIVKIIRRSAVSFPEEELVRCYGLKGKYLKDIPRKKVHKKIIRSYCKHRKKKNPEKFQPYKHKHIGGILIGVKGEIYCQKRSNNKDENPGLIDKIAGGHIPTGVSYRISAYHEFAKEVGIAVGIYDTISWLNILHTCPDMMKKMAVCREPELIENYKSWRVRPDGRSFWEICDQYFTIGYYNGPNQFFNSDHEAIELIKYENIDHLKREIEKHPDDFTEDLKYMVKMYEKELIPLAGRVV
ncbi:hypothetical protein JXB41_01065 [Candidatus Woesearchaeota archaeon]|nr:hypothetical protein [Candidatus Woesearchaeota archaeon]